MNNNRDPLLDIIRDMPEEIFFRVILALKDVIVQNEANHGFTTSSTRALVDLAKEINHLTNSELVEMAPIKQHSPRLFA